MKKELVVIDSLDHVIKNGAYNGKTIMQMFDVYPIYVLNIWKGQSQKYAFNDELQEKVKRILTERGMIEVRSSGITSYDFALMHYTDFQFCEERIKQEKNNEEKYNKCIKEKCWCYGKGMCRRTKSYCDADPIE